MKKLVILFVLSGILLSGCGEWSDTRIPLETTEEMQSTDSPSEETVTTENAVTEPQITSESTGAKPLEQTETSESSGTESPSHGIELPDDNW